MKDIGVEVYKDTFNPAVSEVGAVAGRSVKALLAPIHGLLWGWDRIEEYVENELQERLEKIPEKQIKTPDPEIAVPLLESLTYTAQNKTLRELYIALLANAMDRRKEGRVASIICGDYTRASQDFMLDNIARLSNEGRKSKS